MTCHGNQFALLGKLTCVKLFFYVFLWLCFEEPTVVHWLTKLAELYLVSTIYSSAHCGSATEPLIHSFSAMGLSLAASFVRVSVFTIFVLHMCIYIYIVNLLSPWDIISGIPIHQPWDAKPCFAGLVESSRPPSCIVGEADGTCWKHPMEPCGSWYVHVIDMSWWYKWMVHSHSSKIQK